MDQIDTLSHQQLPASRLAANELLARGMLLCELLDAPFHLRHQAAPGLSVAKGS